MLFVTFLLENFLPDPVRCATSLPEAEIHDCRAKYPNWEEKSCGVSAIGCVSKSLQKSGMTYDDGEAKARCDGLEVILFCAGQPSRLRYRLSILQVGDHSVRRDVG